MNYSTGVEKLPQDRVIVTIDADEDYMRLNTTVKDLGSRARSFKLGQRLLMQRNPWRTVKMLRVKGIDVELDAKYEEDPDQMGPTLADAFSKGFKHVSVAPASGAKALKRAAEAVPLDRGLFVALPSANERLLDLLMHEVMEANSDLGPDQQIHDIMCNVGDISRVKDLGNFTIIATGIRMPGDSQDDHPTVATPAEALSLGADYLAIGRAITAKPDRAEAFEHILANMSSYR